MKTNLKLMMTGSAIAGLVATTSVFATDWSVYGTKRAPAQTISQNAKIEQGGLDGKRLSSKASAPQAAKGTNPSVNRGDLCSKKDVMSKCEFHCGI